MAGDPSMISFGSMDSRAMSITSEDDVTSEHSTESFSSKGNRLTVSIIQNLFAHYIVLIQIKSNSGSFTSSLI